MNLLRYIPFLISFLDSSSFLYFLFFIYCDIILLFLLSFLDLSSPSVSNLYISNSINICIYILLSILSTNSMSNSLSTNSVYIIITCHLSQYYYYLPFYLYPLCRFASPPLSIFLPSLNTSLFTSNLAASLPSPPITLFLSLSGCLLPSTLLLEPLSLCATNLIPDYNPKAQSVLNFIRANSID